MVSAELLAQSRPASGDRTRLPLGCITHEYEIWPATGMRQPVAFERINDPQIPLTSPKSMTYTRTSGRLTFPVGAPAIAIHRSVDFFSYPANCHNTGYLTLNCGPIPVEPPLVSRRSSAKLEARNRLCLPKPKSTPTGATHRTPPAPELLKVKPPSPAMPYPTLPSPRRPRTMRRLPSPMAFAPQKLSSTSNPTKTSTSST